MKKSRLTNEEFEHILVDSKPYLEALSKLLPVHISPEKSRDAFRRADAERPFTQRLTQPEMEELLLQLLCQKELDGFSICERLRETRVKLKVKGAGDAAIYGVLRNLEAKGFVTSEKIERCNEMLNVYAPTPDGKAKTKAYSAEDTERNSLIARLLAVPS